MLSFHELSAVSDDFEAAFFMEARDLAHQALTLLDANPRIASQSLAAHEIQEILKALEASAQAVGVPCVPNAAQAICDAFAAQFQRDTYLQPRVQEAIASYLSMMIDFFERYPDRISSLAHVRHQFRTSKRHLQECLGKHKLSRYT